MVDNRSCNGDSLQAIVYWTPLTIARILESHSSGGDDESSGAPAALVTLLSMMPFATGAGLVMLNAWHSQRTGGCCSMGLPCSSRNGACAYYRYAYCKFPYSSWFRIRSCPLPTPGTALVLCQPNSCFQNG